MAYGGVFSPSALTRSVRAGDSHQFNVNLKTNFQAIVDAASQAAVSNTISFANYQKLIVRGKECVFHSDYHTTLVIRALSRFLANKFSISPPNRNQIVAGVVEGLKDSTPFSVIRRDITSFYENTPLTPLRDELLFDTTIPRSVRHYLSQFFDTHCAKKAHGLPRGLGLSAVLVELAMRDFDSRARAIDGVYRYARYADDILVFTYGSAKVAETQLSGILPPGMAFNSQKSGTTPFDLPKGKTSSFGSFEYLGYVFKADSRTRSEHPREIELSISSKKIQRLKTRLVLTLKAHIRKPDADLLVDRIRFLAGNYRVHRHGMASIKASRYVRAGIFYNYQHCGTYIKGAFTSAPPDSLASLDNFFHGFLWGKSSPFASVKSSLSTSQRTALHSVSFHKGFGAKRIVRLSYKRIAQVKAVWRHV